MQPGGRLVEQVQRAATGGQLPADAAALHRLGQEAGQLQALRLAAAEGGHRLAELHVIEADVDDRLQHAQHLAVVPEQLHRFADREVEHVGDRQFADRRRKRRRRAGTVHARPRMRRQRRRRVRHRQAPLDLHVEQLGAVAAAVAVGAAQVDVAEELHLDVLETRAAAGRAAAVAGVEAEHAGAVAALQRQRRLREQRADLVERAHIAGRVRARGPADRRLVDEQRVAQVVGAEQRIEGARRLGRLAEVARQRRVQHVLDQRALARPRHAGDAHQVAQRKLDRHVLQVVVARALQDQLGRGLGDEPLQAHADALAPAQVGAGQRVGRADRLRRAVEHDAAAAFAGAGAHVDQAVGGQHHGRVVLDHHQRVAGVAQPVHCQDDAVHVARVQADARLVEHEQGVDQRGAQRRREVDALHLAAAERAALPVERQITQADIAQVAKSRANFVEQQLQRVVEHRARQRQAAPGRPERPAPPQRADAGGVWRVGFTAVEEAADALDRHQHQIVQRQARQRLELRARPRHALRQESPCRRQHVSGIGAAAQAPQQCLGLEPRAAAGVARCVAAVLRQQHADVHLVRLALQVFEEALDAVPLLVPVAVPLR